MVTVNYGGKVTEPPVMTKTGSIFGGWYEEDTFTNKWDFAAAAVSGNITLYAKWYSMDADDVADFGTDAVVNHEYNAATIDDWNTTLEEIRGGGNDKNYIINITDNFDAEGSGDNTFDWLTELKVLIRENNTVSMSSSGAKGSILRISTGQAVVVRDVNFTGIADNTDSLIYLYGGALKLKGGASVSGNTVTERDDGGVSVGSGGTFQIEDGTDTGITPALTAT